MKSTIQFFSCLLLVIGSYSQTISSKLQKAFTTFENDSQMKHAISSLYVIDATTGAIVFDKNSQVGLAGASTQKVITATTAFELLGKDYRYKTEFGMMKGKTSNLNIMYVRPSGDPTLGSWRWESTKPENLLASVRHAFHDSSITSIAQIDIYTKQKDIPSFSGGWIWEDIGNYYGAGASELNWHENQFDLFLKSGQHIGDPVTVVGTEPELYGYHIYSQARSAPKGTGDNAYIYFDIANSLNTAFVQGTIPVDENKFKISGSIPSAANQFWRTIQDSMGATNHLITGSPTINDSSIDKPENKRKIFTAYSPSLDSIIYWFLKRSINLYGEALVKTFSRERNGFYDSDSGLNIVRDFWKTRGINQEELNIYDGCGLSPLNRLTTHAQVEVLKFAKSRDWFPYFYDALPEYNGMKMKSGTIRDVKGFCGYQKSSDGKEYVFSFLVNNYSGSTQGVVNKMYTVLDNLK